MALTRIKICGITRAEDALVAAECGADAIGLVFYPPSPRAVTPEQAAAIVEVLPPFVTAVGLFVDAQADTIRDVLGVVPLGMLQFHGEETPEQCLQHHRPWMKALRVREAQSLAADVDRYSGADAILLDSYKPGVPGGTGEVFNWSLAAQLDTPIVLAGGLSPDNVGDAITRLSPAAVDVSGGVESAPGVKDPALIQKFCEAVRAANT